MRKTAFIFTIILITLTSCKLRRKGNDQSIQIKDSIIFSTPDTVTLLFVGDLMQHKAQLSAARSNQEYDYSSYYSNIEKEIKAADLAIINLETPLGVPPYSGYPMFSAPPEFAQAAKDAGFNLFLTANNHSMDRHGKGVKKTIEILDSLGINHLGTYLNKKEFSNNHPYIEEIKGCKLAFLNYTYGTNGIPITDPYIVNLIDTNTIKQDLEKAKLQKSDQIIVCIHWGKEYSTKPNKEQKRLAQWLLKNGANHIIGSHPHVLQPIHTYIDTINNQKQIVAYSLGNFISNMYLKGTDGGLVLKFKLYKKNSKWHNDISYSYIWTGRPQITSEKNFIIYPTSFDKKKMNKNSANKLIIFKQEADRVMQYNSDEIKMFIFK